MTAPDTPAQGWLDAAPGAAGTLEGVLAWSPELMARFKAYYGSFWDAGLLDPALLEMLRLTVARIHGCEAELAIRHEASGLDAARRAALPAWRASDLFTEAERAMLDYAEMIPFQHHYLEDRQAQAVQAHLDEPAFVAFTVALALFDAVCRLRLAFALPARPLVVPAPAGSDLPLH